MKKNLSFIMLFLVLLLVGGCSETWQGVKQDTSDSAKWSKDKVNDGANYIEKKTD
ncbi:MAG: putative small secreted protein [Sulfurimonas sp.]|jgi:predicted small secreted protein